MRKKLSNVIFLLVLIPSLNAQMVKNSAFGVLLNGILSHSVPEISVSEADSLKKTKAIFIDTREKNEFAISHIEGAIFVGYDSLDLSPLENIKKDKEIIVYCSVGYRSEKIAERLSKLGYKNVKNLYGGIFEWKNQNKEVVNLEKCTTEKIHAYNRIWGIWLQKGEKVY